MRSSLGPILVAALIGTSTAASAQTMNAETFFQRASALQRKGPLALFSSDVSQLMAEGKAAGQKSREQRRPRSPPARSPVFALHQARSALAAMSSCSALGDSRGAAPYDRHDGSDDAHPRREIPVLNPVS